MAALHVPRRAGTDIVFLGGLISYIIENGREFRDYVRHYTNARAIIGEEFRDTEDLDGLFSGFDPEKGSYDTASWQYRSTGPPPTSGSSTGSSSRARTEWMPFSTRLRQGAAGRTRRLGLTLPVSRRLRPLAPARRNACVPGAWRPPSSPWSSPRRRWLARSPHA
jgi:hypothetical protein